MRRVVFLGLLLACVAFGLPPAEAANKPCSGRKGGISHCQGETFVCNDGSVSASKRSCGASSSGGGFVPAPAGHSAASMPGAAYPSGEHTLSRLRIR